MTYVPPWEYDQSTFAEDMEYYEGTDPDAVLRAYKNFYYSSYGCGWYACFAMYGFFVGLILVNNIIEWTPRRWLPRWVRAYILEAPLGRKQHNVAFRFLGVEYRIPLRFQSFVILGMFLANIVPLCTFYRRDDDDPFYPGETGNAVAQLREIADRTAVMSVGLLPLIILTAGRQTLGTSSGIDFGNMMLYHRWLARFCWTHVNIHSFAWTHAVAKDNILGEQFKDPYWNWGVAATALFWGLVLLSMRQLRRKYYEAFVIGHIVMAVVGLIATYYHIYLLGSPKSYGVYCILTYLSAILWALDRVVRWLNRVYLSLGSPRKNLVLKAVATNYGGVICRLRIDIGKSHVTASSEDPRERSWFASLLQKWKIEAGTSIRILIPRLQSFSDHPFTVIEADHVESDNGAAYVDLLIRPEAGLTKKLFEKANGPGGLGGAESAGGSTELSVILEGPYGKKHSKEVTESDDVLLFAGGVGIAFSLPYFCRAALHSPESRHKLVWSLREPGMVEAVEEQLVELASKLQRKEGASSVNRPVIELHVTAGEVAAAKDPLKEVPSEISSDIARVISKLPADESAEDASISGSDSVKSIVKDEVTALKVRSAADLIESLRTRLAPTIDLVVEQGRPSTEPTHHFAPVEATSKGAHRTLAVLACGPGSLCDDTRVGALAALTGKEWRDVEYVEECFDW